jgi:hypothetical protein
MKKIPIALLIFSFAITITIAQACTPQYGYIGGPRGLSATSTPVSGGFGSGFSGGVGDEPGIVIGATYAPIPQATVFVPGPIPTYFVPAPQPTYFYPQPQPTYYYPQPVPTYYYPQPMPTVYMPQPTPIPEAPKPYAVVENLGDWIIGTFENLPPYWPPKGHDANSSGLKEYDTSFTPYLNIWSDQIAGWDLLSPLIKINRVAGDWGTVQVGTQMKFRLTFSGTGFIQVNWPGNWTFEKAAEKRYMDIDYYPGTTVRKVQANYPMSIEKDSKSPGYNFIYKK